MVYFKNILTLLHLVAFRSTVHAINELKEFAEEYGMSIDACMDNKISCVESKNTGCIATSQSPHTSSFTVAINLKTTRIKTQILGTVKSKIKNQSYIKYIVEAKEIDKKTGAVGNRIGKFSDYNDGHRSGMCFITFTCNSSQKQDIGMSCRDAKTSKNFEWIAPKGWKGQVQFIATIIQSSQKFWIVDSDVVLIS